MEKLATASAVRRAIRRLAYGTLLSPTREAHQHQVGKQHFPNGTRSKRQASQDDIVVVTDSTGTASKKAASYGVPPSIGQSPSSPSMAMAARIPSGSARLSVIPDGQVISTLAAPSPGVNRMVRWLHAM